MKKYQYYYVSYLFKLKNNDTGSWGFGSTVYKTSGIFNPYEIKDDIDKTSNIECTIIGWTPTTKHIFDWKTESNG